MKEELSQAVSVILCDLCVTLPLECGLEDGEWKIPTFQQSGWLVVQGGKPAGIHVRIGQPLSGQLV